MVGVSINRVRALGPGGIYFATLFLITVLGAACAFRFITHAAPARLHAPSANARSAATPQPTPPGTDDETLHVDTDITNVLLTATDAQNSFFTGLTKADVRIFEDGAEQQIFSFESQTDRPLALVILIDKSTSQELTLPQEKSVATAFLSSVLRPGKDRAAVLSFTGAVTVEQPMTDDTVALRKAIERIRVATPPWSGPDRRSAAPIDPDDPVYYTGVWDSIWDSVNVVLAQTPRQARRAIIILTDGEDTSSQIEQKEAIARAVKFQTAVYALGIGDPLSHVLKSGDLKRLAAETGGRAFFPKRNEDLLAAFKQMEIELRSQYLIAYAPKNQKRDGTYRRILVEITNAEFKKRHYHLWFRPGYYALTGDAEN